MAFLLLAIASSTMITVLMRFGSKHAKSRLGLLCMNYAACTALSAAYAAPGGWQMQNPGATAGLGAVSGILYLLAFVLLQWNTLENGVVLSSVFMKLGVLVPTLMAVLVFHETPALTQGIGFALAITAIVVMNAKSDGQAAKSRGGLLLLLLLGGLADGMSKVYEQLGSAADENLYLLITFAAAMALCMALTMNKREKIGKGEVLFGLLLGIPNFFSSKFLLQSLGSIPAVIAYPTFSVGTIVLAAACSAVIFHERPTKRQLAGIAIILVALALLNA